MQLATLLFLITMMLQAGRERDETIIQQNRELKVRRARARVQFNQFIFLIELWGVFVIGRHRWTQ